VNSAHSSDAQIQRAWREFRLKTGKLQLMNAGCHRNNDSDQDAGEYGGEQQQGYRSAQSDCHKKSFR
jgi:hypothetical protein